MSKAEAAKAKRRVAEYNARNEKPRKPRPGAAFVVHCKGVTKRYPLMIGPTSEQTIQMAADRLDDSGFQELARQVDAQLPPLVLEPLP